MLLRTQSQVFAFDLANLLKKTEVDLLSNLDAIFYTHGHYDHYNKNIAKLLYHRTGAQIIAEPTVASDLKGIIPEEKLISAKPGETFDLGRFNIEYDRFEKEVFKVKPKLVILGASSILFPYNLKRVRETCDRVDAYIGYDASHVLGLIAGKMFQPDPFKNGVDILFGSTHKTFFGPQGGMILTDNDDIAEKILRNMKLKMLDNPHLNRIVGLVQALWEFLMYGEKYARQVVYNAKALGKYLDANNIPVK